jgi:flagellar M-ring protein FliF
VLFANLSEKDGAVVIAKLDQLGVDYKFADGGGTILVPAARVYELRMKLSAAGVNKGSINGYELLDGSTSFGQSPRPAARAAQARARRRADAHHPVAGVGAGARVHAGAAATRTASSASSRSPPPA